MSEKLQHESKEVITLPEWFLRQLPEHMPWTVVSYRDEQFHVSHDDSVFNSVVEAYDYARGFGDDYQIVLDKSVDGHGGESDGIFFYCDTTRRLLSSFTTQDRVTIFEDDYRLWRDKTNGEYEQDPDDFVAAYRWLLGHPAFWRKDTRKESRDKSFEWNLSAGLTELILTVWKDEESNPKLMLQLGHFEKDDFVAYRRDERLILVANSYEKGVVALAKQVRLVFNLDGTELSD